MNLDDWLFGLSIDHINFVAFVACQFSFRRQIEFWFAWFDACLLQILFKFVQICRFLDINNFGLLFDDNLLDWAIIFLDWGLEFWNVVRHISFEWKRTVWGHKRINPRVDHATASAGLRIELLSYFALDYASLLQYGCSLISLC
jgi:hypothetical protein